MKRLRYCIVRCATDARACSLSSSSPFVVWCRIMKGSSPFVPLSLSLSLSLSLTHTHTRTFCSSPFVVSCRMMYVRVYTHLCVHTLTHPPYYSVKRDLQYQKRPTTVSKETYAHLRVHTLTHPPTHPPTHPTHLLPPLCPKHLAPAHSYTSWKSRQ